jgi:hypothetical protein
VWCPKPPDCGATTRLWRIHQLPVQPQFPQCQGQDLARRSAATKPAEMTVLSKYETFKFVSTFESQFPEMTMDYFYNEIYFMIQEHISPILSDPETRIITI